MDWGGDSKGNCYNETTLIQDPMYWGSDSRKSIMHVIDQVFRRSRVPITFLNITQLSSYRRDAHTSIYKKQWNPLTPEQLANPTSYADCVHWCLPGLQDTWNELLFAKLFYPWWGKTWNKLRPMCILLHCWSFIFFVLQTLMMYELHWFFSLENSLRLRMCINDDFSMLKTQERDQMGASIVISWPLASCGA